MATKRITKLSTEWSKIAERVPKSQVAKFQAFRARSDAYYRRMMANPAEPPKLNWAHYKQSIPIPGMVDNFQKQYEAFKVPYPADTATSLIDAQEKEVKQQIENFKMESSKPIAAYKEEVQYLMSLLPYEQMTMEDFYDSHHNEALDVAKRPTFWPHNPQEQLDYKPKDSHHTGSGH